MVMRALVVAVAGLAAAAPAAGATPFLRNQLKPCYVSARPDARETVTIDAGGFDPYAPIAVLVDGVQQQEPPPTSDANGDLRGTVQAPWQPVGQRQFTLQLADTADPPDMLVVTPMVTALGVSVTPARAKPSRKVTFSGSGFTEARPLFAHYLFHGRLRKTVRLGFPAPPCGTFQFRARQIPVPHPHTGEWTVVFDQRRRYPATAPVSDRLIIRVRRVPRSH
jgi:hypothetical protein